MRAEGPLHFHSAFSRKEPARRRRSQDCLARGGEVKRSIALAFLLLCIVLSTGASSDEKPAESPVLQALRDELARAMATLQKQSDPAYFISYEVSELRSLSVDASMGAMRSSKETTSRYLDIDLRIGNYQFDNTHQIRGGQPGSSSPNFIEPAAVPLDDDLDALKSVIWLRTDRVYRTAVERWIQVKANRAVKVAEENTSSDFSRERAETSVLPVAGVSAKPEEWENKIRQYSGYFREYPELHEGSVFFSADALNKYIVNSEGTTIQSGTFGARLMIYGLVKAEDGMDLYRMESFHSHSLAGMPGNDVVRKTVDRIIHDLKALRAAPVIEPYTGPAILSGRAAGVFFHEIFGHRIEGQRQKYEEEGQTFGKQIGRPVLPDFLSVIDDPTSERVGGIDLNGYYLFDDEGVPARRVTIVENGVLRNFLLSRLPVSGFEQSNGHGRKSPGFKAVARQGNLIVKASKTVPNSRLREMLIEEVKRQGKPFGLLFDDISGGFTTTTRSSPQAFQVTPIMVYRVYADGRPDELVRGVDLIGTPLTSFSKIIAAGDVPEVFNGYCGAESGSIPVSAVSPAIITTQIEVQKKPKSSDRVPILPPPPAFREGVQP
jgi:TldD protein